jgi:sulfopyruvate decarboxylase subunit alpha
MAIVNQVWSERILSILRIVAALLFLQHGLAKLFGFPHVANFDNLQLVSLIGLAGLIELFGGLLLGVGLFTRIAAFVMSGEMAFAYFMSHARAVFSPYSTAANWPCSTASCSCISRLPAAALGASTSCVATALAVLPPRASNGRPGVPRRRQSMNDAPVIALSPETVLDEMKKNGVSHVVWLPDSETNWLYLLMKAEPSLRLVGVSREGHACSIAAGLSTAGAKPLILIQNTGMMESGDSLRGWLLGLNIPVVLMVGYRGWTRHGVNQDSAATYTERFLNAFGLNYYLVESDADAPRITIAFEEAERTKKPVVVLVGDEYHGFNR